MAGIFPIGSIMVLVEGTDAATAAARYAIALAENQKAALFAVAVVDTETLKMLFSTKIMVQDEMADFEKELEYSDERRLRYVEEMAQEKGVKVESILLKGSCHSLVLKEIRERGTDLLVMAAFTSSMAKRDLPAKEKQLILNDITCPVILVKESS
jgi:nucleotide-binding universal stress UspA family protein